MTNPIKRMIINHRRLKTPPCSTCAKCVAVISGIRCKAPKYCDRKNRLNCSKTCVARDFASTRSVKMINESSRHVLAECLRILPVRESDSFDMIYQGDVEDVLGLESDGDCLYTAESVYQLADLISSCGDRVGEADD